MRFDKAAEYAPPWGGVRTVLGVIPRQGWYNVRSNNDAYKQADEWQVVQVWKRIVLPGEPVSGQFYCWERWIHPTRFISEQASLQASRELEILRILLSEDAGYGVELTPEEKAYWIGLAISRFSADDGSPFHLSREHLSLLERYGVPVHNPRGGQEHMRVRLIPRERRSPSPSPSPAVSSLPPSPPQNIAVASPTSVCDTQDCDSRRIVLATDTHLERGEVTASSSSGALPATQAVETQDAATLCTQAEISTRPSPALVDEETVPATAGQLRSIFVAKEEIADEGPPPARPASVSSHENLQSLLIVCQRGCSELPPVLMAS